MQKDYTMSIRDIMKFRCITIPVALALIFLTFPSIVKAVPTKLVVRAKANDAKFVGTAVGGLKVVVRDAMGGRILAQKALEGGTRNTDLMMKRPITRGTELSGGGAAKAEFVLDINEPVKLEIELLGPLGAGNDIHREMKTTWLIPGRDITGDGILFNLYGLIVHPCSPKPHEFYPAGSKVTIGANVTPMCGCPVRPGSLWDAGKMMIRADVLLKGKRIAEIPLRWADRISHFQAGFIPKETGSYKIIILAGDSKNDQGVGVTGFVVVPEKKYHKVLGR